jgi:hypothetical protein
VSSCRHRQAVGGFLQEVEEGSHLMEWRYREARDEDQEEELGRLKACSVGYLQPGQQRRSQLRYSL